MSSALELLLERLISKGKELTPSTLRTVASAIDVLGEVCVPGVRPDLVITPPISVLAVDDDPLCLRAVVFALEKAALSPDVATDGEKAVELATGKSYDVIFMDIQMPGIDGLTATSQIRGMEKNEDTPVIFVTVRSDFQTRAESSRLGGTDLIAKPFLQFEITVKALTFAMRKRLQLAASLQRASGSVPAFASPHGHLTTSETTKCQAVAA
jgi:CheY-like chemotaxis protein